MITFEQARQIALKHIGPECVLIENETIEKPFGWCFVRQTRTCAETDDWRDAVVGSCGFIVDRSDGRVFMLGSAYPVETWLAHYERGFKHERYDLRINSVSDRDTALRLLDRLEMQIVIPEREHGTAWKIPRRLTVDQLRSSLRRLPCTFCDQAFWNRVDVFDELDAARCCEYKLLEHVPPRPRRSSLWPLRPS